MNKIVIFVGSSCSGKTTAEEKIISSALAERLLTCTTRAPRETERHGEHYNFLSVEEFLQEDCINIIKITDEWYYGVQPKEIIRAAKSEKPVIYSLINMEFAAGIIKYLQKSKEMDYILVYFNIDTNKRIELMKSRGETEESIQQRLVREDKPEDLDKWGLCPHITVTELTPTLAEDLWEKVLSYV